MVNSKGYTSSDKGGCDDSEDEHNMLEVGHLVSLCLEVLLQIRG